MENHSNKRIIRLAALGLILTTIIWGSAFVVVKNSVSTLPPIYLLASRFFIATLSLAVFLHKKIIHITKKELLSGSLLGVFLFLAYLLQTYGIQYTTASNNAFLTTLYVIFVPYLGWLINKKKPDLYCSFAAFLGVIGLACLCLKSDLTINIGDLLTLLCGLFFALHIIYIDRFTTTQSPAILTLIQLFIATLLSIITAPIFEGPIPFSAFTPSIVMGILYLGVFSTMLGFLLQNLGQKYVAPVTASLLLSLESVFGAVFSFFFLKETFTPLMIAGCGLILFSIILSETKLSFLKPKKVPYN